jgi:hypothetical protein
VSVESIIARSRRRYVDVMSESGTVTAPGTGAGTFDNETMAYSPAEGEEIYEGVFQLRPASMLGGAEMDAVLEHEYVAKFPADTPLARGQAITVASSKFDAGMAGLTVWITEAPSDGWQSTRVVKCIDQRPEVLP